MSIIMQAQVVEQVYQGGHIAVVNPPSADVSPHTKAKAIAFGRYVGLCSGALMGLVSGGLMAYTDLPCNLDKRVGFMSSIILATASITAVTVALKCSLSPGGFIYEQYCASLDAEERQVA
ncbi:hypothetical protein [Endozoicomonas acroporae]|uniref:hypothetical protein n=1 Tax=Endozoicomonas acroporae TaxID=1701104 RepID=UPI003D7BFA2B